MDKDVRHVCGGCHCGRVRFEARLTDGLTDVLRCNCSLCRMRGAVIAFADLDHLRIVSGGDELAVYRFNTNVAQHFFCRHCGIYTHHQRRFNPAEYAINVACLDGVSPFDFAEVAVVDGTHHPLDHGGGPMRVVGKLMFIDMVDDSQTRSPRANRAPRD